QLARCDGDTRGRGVADATPYVEGASELVDSMRTPEWVAEEPDMHLLPHMRQPRVLPLALNATRTLDDGTFEVELTSTRTVTGSCSRPKSGCRGRRRGGAEVRPGRRPGRRDRSRPRAASGTAGPVQREAHRGKIWHPIQVAKGMEVEEAHDRFRLRAGLAAGVVAAALPLIGLVSLLLRRQLDPHLENYRLHFVLFGLVGGLAFVLGYAAGESANRRGDARVLLLSLAFMATGGFMGLHAFGTPGVLFVQDHSGFKVAIPVGLLVSAGFAAASAFVDVRPGLATMAIRHRRLLRIGVLASMALWLVWTVSDLPPLSGPNSEAARGNLLTALAIVGTVAFAISAARYWVI